MNAKISIACIAIALLSACGSTASRHGNDVATKGCSLRSGECSPDEAERQSPAQLDGAATLRLRCGVTAAVDDVSQHRCRQRVEQVFAAWHAKDSAFVPPAAAAIRVTTAPTCVSADCAFFDVRAEADLNQRSPIAN